MQPHLPDPTGLVLVLVGLLLGLQAVYVYLVIGPLKEGELPHTGFPELQR